MRTIAGGLETGGATRVVFEFADAPDGGGTILTVREHPVPLVAAGVASG